MDPNTPSDAPEILVIDDRGASRYQAYLGSTLVGFAAYERAGDAITFTHTEIAHEFEGRGFGSRLAAGALDDVRGHGFAVRVECPFISDFIIRHPEYADLPLIGDGPLLRPRSAGALAIDQAALLAPAPAVAARPRRQTHFRKAIALGLLGATLFVSGMASERLLAPPGLPSEINGFNLGLFAETLSVLDKNYVDATHIDHGKLQAAALNALVEAIGDTGHTSYLTPTQAAALDASLSGSFVGIGVELDPKGSAPVIVRIFPASPAERAGLRAGDQVISVDGLPLAGLTIEDAISHIRGAVGSKVTLVVKGDDGKERTAICTRAAISLPAVEWAMVPGTQIADVRIEQFTHGEGDALVAALNAAKAAGAQSFVLDLRDNPGGYVDEAITTASQFLDHGLVYQSTDATGKLTEHPAQPGGVATGAPLVVLVNKGSASSSEIVTGGLQDAGRAKVVGATTFGTGTVLRSFKLTDGSVLEIGVERWLTPAGHAIWHMGIAPDLAVDQGSAPFLTPGQLAPGGSDWHKDPILAAGVDLLTGSPVPGPTASPPISPSPSASPSASSGPSASPLASPSPTG